MHVHGISNKEKKRNPNLTCEGNNKQTWKQRLKNMKPNQIEAYYIKRNKETEAQGSD